MFLAWCRHTPAGEKGPGSGGRACVVLCVYAWMHMCTEQQPRGERTHGTPSPVNVRQRHYRARGPGGRRQPNGNPCKPSPLESSVVGPKVLFPRFELETWTQSCHGDTNKTWSRGYGRAIFLSSGTTGPSSWLPCLFSFLFVPSLSCLIQSLVPLPSRLAGLSSYSLSRARI